MARLHLHNDALAANIDVSAGGRVSSFVVANTNVLVSDIRDTYDWGMYVMAPYAGRVRDATFSFRDNTYRLPTVTQGHALHGTVIHQDWSVLVHTENEATITAPFGHTWPFSGTCTHRIAVLSDRLRCELTLSADDDMPMQLGWHPWFASPSHVEFSFNAMLVRDDVGITTTERITPPPGPYDDCFLEPNAWPRITIGDVTVEIASDCPYWVRYDAPNGDVCVEPQSGPPNGLNTTPLVLEAGRSFTRWMELRVV